MREVSTFLKNCAAAEEAVTMVEYGLIAALIAIVCIIALTGTGVSVREAFTKICDTVKTAVGGTATCS